MTRTLTAAAIMLAAITSAQPAPMITKDALIYSAVIKLHYSVICKDTLALSQDILKDAAATLRATSEIDIRLAMTNVLVDIKNVGGEKKFCAIAAKKLQP
jgi:hypothetical protein